MKSSEKLAGGLTDAVQEPVSIATRYQQSVPEKIAKVSDISLGRWIRGVHYQFLPRLQPPHCRMQ
jgi:hypothetical protein